MSCVSQGRFRGVIPNHDGAISKLAQQGWLAVISLM